MAELLNNDYGNEEKNKKHNESKVIGDTMKEGGLGQQDIEKKKVTILSNKSFANNIIKTLNAYIGVDEKFDAENKESSVVLTQMENLYEEEKKLLARYKQQIAEKKLIPKTIYDHVCTLQDTLEELEEAFDVLRKKLRTIVKKFQDEEDRITYHNKINGFCLLFRQIYDDITDIGIDQQQLVKKI